MTKKPRMTAGELAKSLAADADYQRKLTEKDQHASETSAEEQRLLAELRQRGLAGGSLFDVVANNAPLSAEVAGLLVAYLQRDDLQSIHESIVRALGASGESFDVTPLVQLFESTDSPSLRWAIANTFAELRPLNLSQWLAAALVNPAYGDSREMLSLGVARAMPSDQAGPLLMSVHAQFPGHAAKALGECGGAVELAFLRRQLPKATGWVKKEIERAIPAIQQRLDK